MPERRLDTTTSWWAITRRQIVLAPREATRDEIARFIDTPPAPAGYAIAADDLEIDPIEVVIDIRTEIPGRAPAELIPHTPAPAPPPAATAARAPSARSRASILANKDSATRCANCREHVSYGELHVVANVYEGEQWDRVERWHQGCYEASGEPYGTAAGRRKPGPKPKGAPVPTQALGSERERECANEKCDARFTTTSPNRRFHTTECANRQAARDSYRRRKAEGKA